MLRSSLKLRVRPGLGLVILGLFVGGCSLFSPSESDVYRLTTVNDHPLPAALVSAVTNEGLYEFQAIRGSLRMSAGGRFSKELDTRNVLDGVPSDTLLGRWSGTYMRTDTSIVIQFTGAQCGLVVVAYNILDNGRRLRGVEGSFSPKIYEYTRE